MSALNKITAATIDGNAEAAIAAAEEAVAAGLTPEVIIQDGFIPE